MRRSLLLLVTLVLAAAALGAKSQSQSRPIVLATTLSGPGAATLYSIDGRVLAWARSDAGGRLEVPLSYSAEFASAAAANDGYVNFDVWLTDGNRAVLRAFSMRFEGGAGRREPLPRSRRRWISPPERGCGSRSASIARTPRASRS